MGCKIKESDIKELRREILCKCRTEFIRTSCYDEVDDVCQEDVQDVDISSTKDNEITEENLPFEEILAEKRRKYTVKEEFIYLLYNDILPAFVTKWEGYFLRKKPSTIHKNDVEIDDIGIGEGEEIDDPYDVSLIKERKDRKEETRVPCWKLSLPDEFADISFYNGNSYSGRISRKMMEGKGTYKWQNGVQYKGQFEQNRIQGRGLLKWNDDHWYEGDFVDGLRHGEGVIVDRKHNRMRLSMAYG